MKVLYLEDNPHDIDLTSRELRRTAPDIQLEMVDTVAAALAWLDDFEAASARGELPRGDLLLLDMKLPDGNGLAVLAEVRHRMLPLAVVVLTGLGDEESVLAALRAGADDYLPKRQEYWRHLSATLRSALAKFRSRVVRHARPIRLLCVEPLEQEIHLTRLHLSAHAPFIHLDVVRTAEQALERLPQSGPVADVDVILMDYRLPGMNALDALKEILDMRGLEVPVILITDNGTEESALQSLKLGAADYIVKSPGYLHRLSSTVENVFFRVDAAREHAALRESEAKYRALIEQAADAIFVSDAQGIVLLANSRACELLGYTKDELIGMNGTETYLEADRGVHAERLARVQLGEALRFERMVRRKDGSAYPAEISVKMLGNGLIHAIFHDITERRELESKIARLNRIQKVLSGINAAIVRIRDRQELLNEACRIAAKQGGFRMAWVALRDPASGELDPVAWAGYDTGLFAKRAPHSPTIALASGGVGTRAVMEQRTFIDNDILANPEIDRMRREAIDNGCRSVIGLPLSVAGETVGALMLYAAEKDFFDGQEVRLLEELAADVSFALTFIAQQEKVEHLAYYDTLTGLPNRSLFFDRLGQQLDAARRDHAIVALVLFDLDRFRLVNDTLGRQAGDALLAAVAKRLDDASQGQDSAARVGPNRFALALSGISNSTDAALALETRSAATFGEAFVVGPEKLRVLATSGVAMFPDDGNDPESLFANAEAALRKAKTENLRSRFYSPEINARVADSLRFENKLRRALENGEMVLWYQPKVSVKTRELAGFEALMRWQDPESGMVPPMKFIPLMEQTGLILEAGRWALSQAARDCKRWTRAGVKRLHIAVNVSPLQLQQKDFVGSVISAMDEMAGGGGALDLEITESTVMKSLEAIVPMLQAVRGFGVEVAVDDFGTGYSSLAYIARLPIHGLKIDRSFVVGMTESQDSLAIVKSVISLAHSLRLEVVAEGVETEEQAELLLELGCDQMQGYLISKPVPPEQVPELIRTPMRGAAQ